MDDKELEVIEFIKSINATSSADDIRKAFNLKATFDGDTSWEFDDTFGQAIASWVGEEMTKEEEALLSELMVIDSNDLVDDSDEAVLEELSSLENDELLSIPQSFKDKYNYWFS